MDVLLYTGLKMLKWLLPSHLSLHMCIFYIIMYTKRNVRVGLPEEQNVRVTEKLSLIKKSENETR